MADYKRMVSYLYKYRNGTKGENVGYVRVEKMNEEIKYVVRLRDRQAPEGATMQVCMYYEEPQGRIMGVPCGCLQLVRGEGEFKGQTQSNNVCGGNQSFEDMSGLVVYYNQDWAYGTQWDGVSLDMNQFSCVREDQEANGQCQIPDRDFDDEYEDDLNDDDDFDDSLDDDREDRDDGEDYLEDLLEELGQEELEEAQRGPNTQPLWGNQPNTNGESFQQIDRVVQNNPRLPNMEGSIIGIPGVYSRENEYLAALFGFKEFLPLRGMPVRAGTYGYWIRPLQQQE